MRRDRNKHECYHEYYMDRALKLAYKGWGKTNPNPLVGAVIVKGGLIQGEGYHSQYGGPHAEVEALRAAGKNAENATMYVTLEPCSHHGKTPPCVDNVIESKLEKVVIAMEDPNENVRGKGIKKLKHAGIKVETGIREQEARKLNEVFVKYITEKRPFVIAKWAMSLDGKIATRTGDSKWITNEKARRDVHHLRARTSCIMVGINTVLEDDPILTCRHPEFSFHDPTRVILDSGLKLPLNSRLAQTAGDVPTILVTNTEAFEAQVEKLDLLKKNGIKIIKAGDLFELFNILGELKYDSVLAEGGAGLHGQLLENRLVDKFICYLGNVVIGGSDALSPVGGMGPEKINEALNLEEVEMENFEDNIKITGYPGEKSF